MNVDKKHRYRKSDKLKLSSDAKILVALMRKQPQQLDELCKNAGIHKTLFYRMRRLLINRGILKETEKGYALWFYDALESKCERAIKELSEMYWQVTRNDVGIKARIPVDKIKEPLFRYASKYDLRIGEQRVRRVTPLMDPLQNEPYAYKVKVGEQTLTCQTLADVKKVIAQRAHSS